MVRNCNGNKNGTVTGHSFGYGGSGFKFNLFEDEPLRDNTKIRLPNLVLLDKLNNHHEKIECISNGVRFNYSLDEKITNSRLEPFLNNSLDSILLIKLVLSTAVIT